MKSSQRKLEAFVFIAATAMNYRPSLKKTALFTPEKSFYYANRHLLSV